MYLRLYGQNVRDTLVRHQSTLALMGHMARESGAIEDRALGTLLTLVSSGLDPGMAGFTLVDSRGMAVAGSSFTEGELPWPVVNEPNLQEMWERLLVGEQFVVGRPQQNLIPGEWTIPIGVAVRDDQGDIDPAAAMAMMIVYSSAGVRILHGLMTRGLQRRSQAWRRRDTVAETIGATGPV